MGDLLPLFGPATDVDVDVLLARLTALRAGYLDELAAANIPSDVDDILADTGELQTDWANGGRLDLLIDAILADTGELQTDWANGGRLDLLIDAIKAKTDILSAVNIDVSDSITWVTATHTTNEGDISALFSTPLTGSTRRRYAVFIDLTGAEADGAAWTKCTVRVKIGFGVGDAYRTVDLKEIAKTAVAAAKEPGINIDVPATAKNVQITLQFDVALAGDATIYYSYVCEALE